MITSPFYHQTIYDGYDGNLGTERNRRINILAKDFIIKEF
jgi:hypothetical protein